MNKFITLLLLLLFTSFATAQTQQGIVKTRGRVVNGKVVPGTKLSGATITLSLGNPQVSQAQGTFSFNVPAGKSFSLVSAKKQGYTLADPEYTRRTFRYSAGNPFYVVLEDEAQRQADIKEATDKVRKTLKRELRKREDELDELRESNAITQAKYDSLRMEFATYRQSSEALVYEMAERFAAIDYDQLDEFNRQVQQYIEEGELLKADSLINTRGSLEERYARVKEQESVNTQREEEIRQQQESLSKSQELTQREKEDLMSDLYAKHTIYLQAYQQDSALYCLKMRADLDTTNVEAVSDYATFSMQQGKYTDSEKYYATLLNILEKKCAEDSVTYCRKLLFVQHHIGQLYLLLRDYDKCEKYCRLALKNIQTSYKENLIVSTTESPSEVAGKLAYLEEYGSILNDLGLLYFYMKNYSSCEECYLATLKNRELICSLKPESYVYCAHLAGILHNLGWLYATLNDFSNSEKYYLQSLEKWEIVLSIEPNGFRKDLAMTQNNIGLLYYTIADYASCEKYYMLALENRQHLFNQNPDAYRVDLAMSYSGLGTLYCVLHNYIISEKYYKMELEQREHLFKEYPDAYREDLTKLYYNLGVLYEKINDYATSEKYYMLALENYEQLFKQNPDAYRADLASTQNGLVSLYRDLQDYSTSEKYCKLALENYEQLFTHNPDAYRADLARTYYSIMWLYAEMNNMEEYDKYLNLALKNISILYQLEPSVYIEVIIELQNRKVLRMLVKEEIDEAVKLAETTYAMDESNEESKYWLAMCFNGMAIRSFKEEDLNNSFFWIEKAIKLYPNEAVFYHNKGEYFLSQGDSAKALEMWKKVLELNPNFLDNYPDGTNLSNGLKKLGLIE